MSVTGLGSTKPRARLTLAVPHALSQISPHLWIVLLYAVITLWHADTWPIWDGGYYAKCLLGFLDKPTRPNRLDCFGHPSWAFFSVLALPQLIFGASFTLMHVTQIALGCVGIHFFYRLLTELPFVSGRTEKERHAIALLTTSLLAFHPVYIANSVHVTPDFGITVFSILFLYFLLKGSRGGSFVFGMAMIFSKEPGLLVYGSFVALYFFFFILHRPGTRTEKFRHALSHFHLVLLPILFFGYLALKKALNMMALWVENSHGTGGVLSLITSFRLFDPLFLSVLGTVVIIGFSWVPASFLLIHVVKRAVYFLLDEPSPPAGTVEARRYQAFFVASFFLVTFFLTRYLKASLPRYMLPCLPVFLLASVHAVQDLFPSFRVRAAVIATWGLLFFVSIWRTVDPLSKTLYGTHPFGDHAMLDMTGISGEPLGYGIDSSIYNLEFTRFAGLIKKAHGDVIKENAPFTMFAWWGEQWPNGLPLVTAVERKPELLYYIESPFLEPGLPAELKSLYANDSERTYDEGGYSLRVHRLTGVRPVAPTREK